MTWQRQAPSGPVRAFRCIAGVWLVLAVFGTGTSAAEFDPASTDLGRFRSTPTRFAAELPSAPLALRALAVDRSARMLPPSQGFYQHYLLPRLTTQFDRLTAYRDLPANGQARDEFVLLDHITDAAQRRAERGLTKAVRNYLLETTSLGRWIDSFGTESTRTLGGEARTRAFRSGVGIAHGLPRLDLRYGAGKTVLRLGVSADQSVGFEMRRNGPASAASLSAKYDRDEQAYTMDCRISF